MKNLKKKIAWMLSILMLLSVCCGTTQLTWAADDETTLIVESGGGIDSGSYEEPTQSSEAADTESGYVTEETSADTENDFVTEETTGSDESVSETEKTSADTENDFVTEETTGSDESVSETETAAKEAAADSGSDSAASNIVMGLMSAAPSAGLLLASSGSTGLVQSVVLYDADGNEISSGDKVSKDDTFKVKIYLNDITSTDSYADGNIHTVIYLPKQFNGVTLSDTALTLEDDSSVEWGYMSVSSEDGDGYSSVVKLRTDTSVLNEYDIKGIWMEVEVSFDSDAIGDAEEIELVFSNEEGFSTSYTLKIAENQAKAPTVAKALTEDGNVQTWTVTVTEDTKQYSDETLTLTDVFSATNGEIAYVEGSLKITDVGGNDVTSTSSATISDNTITCQLEQKGDGNTWTITYQTETSAKLVQYSSYVGYNLSYKNTATLTDESGTFTATDSKSSSSSSQTALQISKTASAATSDGDNGNYILYTITVTNNGYDFSNVTLKDVVTSSLNSGYTNLSSVGSGLVIKDLTVKDGGGNVVSSVTSSSTDVLSGSKYTGTIDISLGNIASDTGKYVITYRVYATDWADYIKYNEGTISNTVTMNFSDGEDNEYKISSSKSGVELAGTVLTKGNGTYDTSTHQITWHITVNENQASFDENLVLQEAKGSYQKFVGYENLTINGTAVATGESWNYDGTSEKTNTAYGSIEVGSDGNAYFTFLSSVISGATVEFDVITEVTDPTRWQSNKTTTYDNWANLYLGEVNGSNTLANDDAYVSHTSDVLKKTVVTTSDSLNYDYSAKTVDWQITVNNDKVEMTNPVVTDTLPQGFSLVTGTLKVDGTVLGTTGNSDGEYYTYNEDTRVLTVYLKSVGTDTAGIDAAKRVITFTTLVDVDTAVSNAGTSLSSVNGTVSITNTASLSTDELTAAGVSSSSLPSASGTASWNNNLLAKTGVADTEEETVDYEVVINTMQVTLPDNTVVTDTLSAGMLFSLPSITLYKAQISSSGTYTYAEADKVEEGWSYKTSTDDNGCMVLTVTLDNPGNDAYVLAYTVKISDKSLKEYTNNVSMGTASGTSASASDKNNAANAFAGGGGGGSSSKVYFARILSVEEGDETPLAGAVYSLTYDENDVVPQMTSTDDEAGLTVRGLDGNVEYLVQMVTAPEGYELVGIEEVNEAVTTSLDSESAALTVTAAGSTNAVVVKFIYRKLPATADVEFISVSSKTGSRLAGARFGLYSMNSATDETGTLVATSVSDSSGTVSFTVEAGEYEIRLISAPEGYDAEDDTPIVLSVNDEGEIEYFYFKGGDPTNLLADGSVEVLFSVAADTGTGNDPVNGTVTVEEDPENSGDTSDNTSGGTWNEDYTYLVSPKTGR